MTAIVISEGESGWVEGLVQALKRGTGCAAMDDAALLKKVTEGRMASTTLLSWALFGALPSVGRMVMNRKYGKARVCQEMISALGRGVRIFNGDLGHLLQRFPVMVFRVLISGDLRGGRRRRHLFGRDVQNHFLYDLYLPGGPLSVERAAKVILERSAVALGDPGRPLPGDRLRLAADMAEAELDLLRRGVDVDFWGPTGDLTVWNHSSLGNAELKERVRRAYALGASCRRGLPPSIFGKRVPYAVRMRVEGERLLGDAVASVASRNGGRLGTAMPEVVVCGGLGWGGRLVVDLSETLTDPEEVIWRLMALYPERRLIVPAPRYAWLVSRLGLEIGERLNFEEEGEE